MSWVARIVPYVLVVASVGALAWNADHLATQEHKALCVTVQKNYDVILGVLSDADRNNVVTAPPGTPPQIVKIIEESRVRSHQFYVTESAKLGKRPRC